MTLRPYQRDAVTAVFDRFDAGERRTALVLATGAGKTVIFSEFIRQWRERVPGQILVLAHRSELLNQAAEKIRFWAPGLRVGLVKAGVNQTWADVVVASQQTLQREARRQRLPEFSLIVVDECHRSMSPTYQIILDGLGAQRPDGPRVLGVTATFTREDSKRLTEFYQSVAFSMDILDLIEQGYLVPPKFRRVLVEGLDLTAVRSSRMSGGKDLAPGELDEAMERAGAAGVVAAAYKRHAADRPGFVFTPTVHSAELVRDALRAEGITSELLHGGTPGGERAGIMRRYNAGALQTVVNCAILTEGVDAPRTSCVVMARPTLSKILFRQVVGRGLRLHPESGKADCLVLDLVGATGRNDLRTLNDVTDAPVDVREDELLTDAVKRVREELGARAELIGDALVSGSLEVIETDPWEAERRAKLSPRERLLEDAGSEGPAQLDQEQNTPEPAEPRERYHHVEYRSGWFLRTAKVGNWFIPLRPNDKQQGFVVIVNAGDQHLVAVSLPGIRWQDHLTALDSAERAAQVALDLTLELVQDATKRGQIDPDARWRRRPYTTAQKRFLDAVDIGNGTETYQGQASDLITVAKMSAGVDAFAGTVARSLATVLA